MKQETEEKLSYQLASRYISKRGVRRRLPPNVAGKEEIKLSLNNAHKLFHNGGHWRKSAISRVRKVG